MVSQLPTGRNSPGHPLRPSVDPRAALLAALAFVVVVASLPDAAWLGMAAAYGALLAAALAARVSILTMLRRSMLVVPFVLAAAALPFTTPGTPAGVLPWGWPYSVQGLVKAGSLLLRAWLSIQAFVLLITAIRLPDLLAALERLGLPSLLSAVVGFAYRYLALIQSEGRRMLRARQARSAGKGPKPWDLNWQLTSAGSLLGSLFLRSLDRSERVHAAMVARGYQGTSLSVRQLQWARRDWLLLLCCAAGLAIVTWLGTGPG